QNHPMKQIHKIRLILFGLCGLCIAACADDDADRAALREIKAAYEQAVNSNDLSKIAPHLADGVTGVMVTAEEIKSFKDLESYWQKIKGLIGAGGSYHVTVNVDKTDIVGDIAVSRGSTDDFVHSNAGRDFKFKSFWTSVCRKEN